MIGMIRGGIMILSTTITGFIWVITSPGVILTGIPGIIPGTNPIGQDIGIVGGAGVIPIGVTVIIQDTGVHTEVGTGLRITV